MGTTETCKTTATKLARIAKLSASDPLKRFDSLMHLFNEESLAACFHALDGKKAVGVDGVIYSTPCSNVNDFVLSLLPELGTMGSKRGGVGVTRSSTSYAVWLYYRFNLSHRDIEDLLAQRGITVSREAIRLWCIKFGAIYTRRLKRKHRGYGDTFFIDEVFVKINGKQHYLWRAVDQDGEVVDGYIQAKRDGVAAKRFFRRLLRSHGSEPRKIVTDKLRSYGVAHRELMPEVIHSTDRYENNRAEQSHEAI